MTSEQKEQKREIKEVSSLYVDGSLLNLETRTGYQEFGSVLKYVPNSELRAYDPDLPDSITDDYSLVGTYHLAEVAEIILLNKEERPTLYLMPTRVIDADNGQMMFNDAEIDDEMKKRLFKDLQAIADRDEEINDRVNDLLSLSAMACMTHQMAVGASQQAQEMEEALNDSADEEILVEAEAIEET